MYKAVCSKCGKDCEIPFQPTGSRPVFCRDCFRENAAAGDRRPFGERTMSRPTTDGNTEYSHLKDQLASINAKLEKLVILLTPAVVSEEAPVVTEERPVLEKKKRVAKKVEA